MDTEVGLQGTGQLFILQSSNQNRKISAFCNRSKAISEKCYSSLAFRNFQILSIFFPVFDGLFDRKNAIIEISKKYHLKIFVANNYSSNDTFPNATCWVSTPRNFLGCNILCFESVGIINASIHAHQHSNTSTHQHTSTHQYSHQHVNTSTHQHINTSAHQHCHSVLIAPRNAHSTHTPHPPPQMSKKNSARFARGVILSNF